MGNTHQPRAIGIATGSNTEGSVARLPDALAPRPAHSCGLGFWLNLDSPSCGMDMMCIYLPCGRSPISLLISFEECKKVHQKSYDISFELCKPTFTISVLPGQGQGFVRSGVCDVYIYIICVYIYMSIYIYMSVYIYTVYK